MQNQTFSKTDLRVILLGGLTSSALAGTKYLGSILWIETEDVSEPNENPFQPCQVNVSNWAFSTAGKDVLNIYVGSLLQIDIQHPFGAESGPVSERLNLELRAWL